jgi:hypothetical protein
MRHALLRCPRCAVAVVQCRGRQLCVRAAAAAGSQQHRTRTPLTEERRQELLPQAVDFKVAPIPEHYKARGVAWRRGAWLLCVL